MPHRFRAAARRTHIRSRRAGESCVDQQQPDGVERRTLTVPEAAKALGIGRSLAYEMARTGQLPTIRLGRRVLIPAAALEALLGVPDA